MRVALSAAPFLLLALGLAFLSPIQAQTPTPTPTYDPFAEPPLPDHPTQLELGRHLFWHHCMPCHGDVGQGLTDEFRALWEPDHQECWASGCHSGRPNNEGFPIPTVVPPLAGAGLLTRYSPESLFEYLRATHPPQNPGLLADDDYRALVAFLYDLNDAPLPVATATPAPSAAPTSLPSFTPTPNLLPSEEATRPFGLWLLIPIILLTLLLVVRDRNKK